ncbi:hypothetical protein [Streptomyces sp. XD-27]|uniref:hypothetical protein n=1 Tax=Streptomyces sp. XD-27 TaxID=3062779 RepID=UPI0026F436EC|nr:hypothetical protein [Streptomyces sp. XD-27]WKX70592.1 hypothetical protein Q3Y56_12305 [Streptomyces sp. XD-27]
MPRPTRAQFAYGSATVILSTLAMLLLSQSRSGLGVAVVAVAALALGLLVAVTAPLPGARRRAVGVRSRCPVASGGPAARQVDECQVDERRADEPRVDEHSLHG